MFVEDYRGGSGKLEMLSTLIPEYLEAHHRILIFSQFVKALESVRNVLEKQGIPTSFLSGATPAKERVEMMDAFNNGSGTDVFLISLKAGGTGLNLTGADTVIHLDPWWNVAAENQASDRTHRIGQTRNVEVIRLIAGESIEQRVVELQDLKKEVIRQVISDDDGSVTSASLEDIASKIYFLWPFVLFEELFLFRRLFLPRHIPKFPCSFRFLPHSIPGIRAK